MAEIRSGVCLGERDRDDLDVNRCGDGFIMMGVERLRVNSGLEEVGECIWTDKIYGEEEELRAGGENGGEKN